MTRPFSIVHTGRNLTRDVARALGLPEPLAPVELTRDQLPTDEQLEITHSKPITIYSEELH